VVARLSRYREVRGKLEAGEVRSINDLITYNLDIIQFAQDVISTCEGPELLRAFWQSIEKVTVLDPTCGSGAFLFAALNLLEPLYEACLERMEAFLGDLERSGESHRPEKYSDFKKVLAKVAGHANRRYFVLKSIVVSNLYGVDLMEEAVEICKLRLFLKLVAQLEPGQKIEPLPDIDFNIKAGNTLVGYATYDQVKHAVGAKMDFDNTMGRIEEKAGDLDRLFARFREQQTELGVDAALLDKSELRRRLGELDEELDHFLATEYKVKVDKSWDSPEYRAWHASHRPFHWFLEFYGTMKRGGFDVIIGNPPWKEYSAAKKDYAVRNYFAEGSGNLHALTTERALGLRSLKGRMSFIVQLPLASSSRMSSIRRLLREQSESLFVIPFDDRPGKLFEGLQHCRSVVFLSEAGRPREAGQLAVSGYQRWPTAAREHLFATLGYVEPPNAEARTGQFPKCAIPLHRSTLNKLRSRALYLVGAFLRLRVTEHFVFYQEATQYWVKASVGLPYYDKNGIEGAPAHGRYMYLDSQDSAYAVCALLNSSLFYTYFIAFGDCFHLSETLASGFPITEGLLADQGLIDLGRRLMVDLRANSSRETIQTRDGDAISYEEFYGWKSKRIIDEIDRVLAKHYGLTDEELDFIINYDIKYRMGRDGAEEE